MTNTSEHPRCLWLTRLVPFPPNLGGDFIWSSRLIESTAAAGVSVEVLTLDPTGSSVVPRDQKELRWHVVNAPERPSAAALLRRQPISAYRHSPRQVRDELVRLLRDHDWSAIVLDNLASAWALPIIREAQGSGSQRSARLVFLTQNHEATVRRQLAAAFPRTSPQGLALRLDSRHVAQMERRLARDADVVITISAEDAARFEADRDSVHYGDIEVLTPGYDGPVRDTRPPMSGTPRRILVAGSFGWVGKRLDLDRFLREVLPHARRAGVMVRVAGAMPPEYRRSLSSEFPDLEVHSPVDDFRPHLSGARVGVVPEPLGGGFKLKALQYVFNRVPVVAVAGTVAGMPLVPGRSIEETADMPSLARRAVQMVDEPDLLDRMQEAAFDACAEQFSWADRGQHLARALLALRVPAET